MIVTNPLTQQTLNANPEGHNQYVNPDGPTTPKSTPWYKNNIVKGLGVVGGAILLEGLTHKLMMARALKAGRKVAEETAARIAKETTIPFDQLTKLGKQRYLDNLKNGKG